MKKGKTLSTEVAWDNKWFRVLKDVVEFPNGKIVDDYYVWKSRSVAMVIAFTTDKKVVLVKQYKHGGNDIFIEAPAGYVEEGEDPKSSALRELKEETGYEGDKIELIGKITNEPSKQIGEIYIYLLLGAKKTGGINLDELEEIEVLEVPVDEILEWIYEGKIRVSGTIAAIFLALKKLGYKYELH